MTDIQDSANSLFRRVRRLRYILPIAAFLLVVVHQSLIHGLRPGPFFPDFLWQVLLYGTVGPIVVWFALTSFARWVQERDETEAHLRCLYRISRQAATATEMEALVALALHMPEEILSSVATSMILREHPEAPWNLAGTHNLPSADEETLVSRLTAAGSDLLCGQCETLSATAHQDCPLQLHLDQAYRVPSATTVICLPLSTEHAPLALLNVYLFDEDDLPIGARRVLESMAAVLSVALDHARLRAREFQMLHRMEQATRQRQGLVATTEHILADIVTVHRARAGELFLVTQEGEKPSLTSIATWPDGEAHLHLITPALQALLEANTVISTPFRTKGHAVAVPLLAEGQTTGVLVLIGSHPFTPSQRAFLQVAAGMMALMIRNSQLYAELEGQAVLEERNRLAREFHDGLAQSLGFLNFKMQQVERLLARQQWEAAQEALCEMREGVRGLYDEVRLTIQDLRWPPEDGQGLLERLNQYVLEFEDRTGLDISLALEGEPSLAPQDEVHLLRIVQEALTNVHKHAQARHAWVRLRTGPKGTTLEVEDDGKGMMPEIYHNGVVSSQAAGHYGLRIMQERAEAMGGQLSWKSTPGQGTHLLVSVGTESGKVRPDRSLESVGSA